MYNCTYSVVVRVEVLIKCYFTCTLSLSSFFIANVTSSGAHRTSTHQSIEVIADSVEHWNNLYRTAGTTHLSEPHYVGEQDAYIVQVVHHHRTKRHSERLTRDVIALCDVITFRSDDFILISIQYFHFHFEQSELHCPSSCYLEGYSFSTNKIHQWP